MNSLFYASSGLYSDKMAHVSNSFREQVYFCAGRSPEHFDTKCIEIGQKRRRGGEV